MNLEELLTPETKADGDLVYGQPGACRSCGREYQPDVVDTLPTGRQVFWYRIPDDCCPARARYQISAYRREITKYQGAENARQRDFTESVEQRLSEARTDDQRARLRGRQYRPAIGVDDEIRDLQERVRRLTAANLERVRGTR